MNKNREIIFENFISKEDIKNVFPYINKQKIACDFVKLDRRYVNIKNDKVKNLKRFRRKS
ncbi:MULTISPECIES: hypothetical protein [unclassified Gemella]|uniref:hypothetical protein n=1 Tax=unclassified Gemella TaxID=2624949 RepID=UPI00207B8DB0|nr:MULTISPECIES: hypothetical protein [unclassified Gemella]